jgi:hypothetical protein
LFCIPLFIIFLFLFPSSIYHTYFSFLLFA